ncbi:MAG: flagellar export chaperone FliS [Candidatus Zixiibacteriota bacterium]
MDGKVNSYWTVDTIGKSPVDLVIQVYDGAIGALQAARTAYEGGDNETGHLQIEKVQRFLTHLYTTLDNENGGEIADQLGRLYAFVLSEMTVIEATKDIARIDDTLAVLNNLREGWHGIKDTQSGDVTATPADGSTAPPAGTKGFVTSA